MQFNIYIDQVIITYKISIKLRILYAVLLIFLGVVIILLNVFSVLIFPAELKNLISISGTLISSICAFPIKEIVDRANKIRLIKLLSTEYDNSIGKDKKKIEELLWKFIEKNTVG